MWVYQWKKLKDRHGNIKEFAMVWRQPAITADDAEILLLRYRRHDVPIRNFNASWAVRARAGSPSAPGSTATDALPPLRRIRLYRSTWGTALELGGAACRAFPYPK